MRLFSFETPVLHAYDFNKIKEVSDPNIFGERYKSFKDATHCQNIKDIIKVSQNYLRGEHSVDELNQIKDGLKTLRNQYEIVYEKDRPVLGFLRKYFPRFFKRDQEDQSIKLTFDLMIHQIDEKIHQIETHQHQVKENFDLKQWRQNLVGKPEEKFFNTLLNSTKFMGGVDEEYKSIFQLWDKGSDEKLQITMGNLHRFAEKMLKEHPQLFAGKDRGDTSTLISEAFLVGLAQLDKTKEGNRLLGFITRLREMLSKADFDALELNDENVRNWSGPMLTAIKQLTKIDLDRAVSKKQVAAGFVNHIRSNRDEVRGSLSKKLTDSYQEPDKDAVKQVESFLMQPSLKKNAIRLFRLLNRKPVGTPRDELNWMAQQLPDSEAERRAMFIIDTQGKRTIPLLLKIKELFEESPALMESQAGKRFRNLFDFSCKIDPKEIANKLPTFERTVSEKAVKSRLEWMLEENRADLKKTNPGKSEPAKKVLALVGDKEFVSDARTLFNEFLMLEKWAGTGTKGEQFGGLFLEFVKKHKGKILSPEKAFGGDDRMSFMEACFIAGGDTIPSVIKKVKEMDEEVIANPQNLKQHFFLDCYLMANHVNSD